MTQWHHERMNAYSEDLRQEDNRSSPSRHGQEPGRSHFLREPLLGQALRQDGRRGTLARPQEEARIPTQDRPERKKAAGGRLGAAPDRHALRKATVPGEGMQDQGALVDGFATLEPD